MGTRRSGIVHEYIALDHVTLFDTRVELEEGRVPPGNHTQHEGTLPGRLVVTHRLVAETLGEPYPGSPPPFPRVGVDDGDLRIARRLHQVARSFIVGEDCRFVPCHHRAVPDVAGNEYVGVGPAIDVADAEHPVENEQLDLPRVSAKGDFEPGRIPEETAESCALRSLCHVLDPAPGR